MLPCPSSSCYKAAPKDELQIVGLIPAAGLATRLGLKSGNKELLTVPTGAPDTPPRVISEFLIEQMVRAGCQRVFFILRSGKWAIAEHFGHGANFGIPIGYLVMNTPYGPPFTISQAFPFIADSCVLTGFPDILIEPADVCKQVVQRLSRSNSDVVIATFPCKPDVGFDLVETDVLGNVSRIVPKEYNPIWHDESRTWLVAAWRNPFTEFFAKVVARLRIEGDALPANTKPEWPMGTILMKALEAGMSIETVHFAQGRFLDIGTPERLAQATTFFGNSS